MVFKDNLARQVQFQIWEYLYALRSTLNIVVTMESNAWHSQIRCVAADERFRSVQLFVLIKCKCQVLPQIGGA